MHASLKRKKMKTLILLLCIVTIASCNKKEEDDDVVTVSELLPFVGSWAKCQAVTGKGTDFGGAASYRIQLAITAAGTYTHNRWYYSDSATCTGVENAVSWSEAGTVAVVTDSGSVSGAKEISFDRSSSSVTVRNMPTGAPTKMFLDHFKIVFNPFAPPSMTVTDPTGIYLNNGATVVMGDFVVNTGITYNTVSVSGTTMSMKEPLDWHMGQISAPASQDFDLIKF